MKLIFIGPQGSGKGTQAKIISKRLGIPHISTGDLLRSATGKLREEIDSYIVKGNLLPDRNMLEVLREKLEQESCEKGFILDGFPRNLEQAEMLDDIVAIDKVIEIYISDDEAIMRLSGRVSCSECGRGYNLVTMPPKDGEKCDECGGKLVQRDDDKEKAIRKRLEIYHRETEPMLKYYNAVRINGEQEIEWVTKEIISIL